MIGASVYQCGDAIVVVPKGKSPSGWIMGRLDMEVVDDLSSPDALQIVLRKALDRFDLPSNNEVYNPKIFDKELSKAAGRKSYSSFLNDAALVEVAISKDEVILQPLQPSSTFKGLESYQNIVIRLALGSLEDGTAAKEVMALLKQIQSSNTDIA